MCMNCAHPGILRFCIKGSHFDQQNHSALGSPRHHNQKQSRNKETSKGWDLSWVNYISIINFCSKSNAFKMVFSKMVILVTIVKVFFLLSLFVDSWKLWLMLTVLNWFQNFEIYICDCCTSLFFLTLCK